MKYSSIQKYCNGFPRSQGKLNNKHERRETWKLLIHTPKMVPTTLLLVTKTANTRANVKIIVKTRAVVWVGARHLERTPAIQGLYYVAFRDQPIF